MMSRARARSSCVRRHEECALRRTRSLLGWIRARARLIIHHISEPQVMAPMRLEAGAAHFSPAGSERGPKRHTTATEHAERTEVTTATAVVMTNERRCDEIPASFGAFGVFGGYSRVATTLGRDHTRHHSSRKSMRTAEIRLQEVIDDETGTGTGTEDPIAPAQGRCASS